MRFLIVPVLFISVFTHGQGAYVDPSLFLGAVQNKNITQVKKYLDMGVSADTESSQYPAKNSLIIAVDNNDMPMFDLLIRYKADITGSAGRIIGDIRGFNTPLKNAVYYENKAFVKKIIGILAEDKFYNSMEKGYIFAQELEFPEMIQLFESSGYISKRPFSEDLTDEKINIYRKKYPELSQKEINLLFSDRSDLLSYSNPLRIDFFRDKAFLKYLKENLNVQVTFKHLDRWVDDFMRSIGDETMADISYMKFIMELFNITFTEEDHPRVLYRLNDARNKGHKSKELDAYTNFITYFLSKGCSIDKFPVERPKIGYYQEDEAPQTQLNQWVEEQRKRIQKAAKAAESARIKAEKEAEKAKKKAEKEANRNV